jgi:predicted Zn-dependent peptidase
MVNGININNPINNIQPKSDVLAQNSAATSPLNLEKAKKTEPVYPVYAPIQPKGATKLGEVKIPNSNNAQVYELANGQKVIALKKKGPVTINTYVGVGSVNEPDNIRGISHYIEHNLFNGSSQLKPDEFVDDVKAMGGVYNASTGFASTNYFISCPIHEKSDLDKMLSIHANMLEAPTFDPKMLEKEKGIVCSEIQMLDDQPYQKAENVLLKNLFQVETKSSDLIGGCVSNIQALNKNTVNDYYQKYYTPDNMTTVIAGDIEPDEVANKLNKLFISRRKPSQREAQPLKPIEKTVREDITSGNVSSTSVNLAFVGPKNKDIKEEIATNALMMAMAGTNTAPLSKSLEKFNTDAAVRTEMVSNKPEDHQAIIVNASFADGQQEDGLKAIYSSLHQMKYVPVSNEELGLIKDDIKRQYKEMSESSMMLTQMIGTATLTNDAKDIDNAYKAIDELKPQDIQDAASKYLDLNKASVVVLHPQAQQKDVSFKGALHSDAVDKLDLGETETFNLRNNISVDYNKVDSPFSYMTMSIKNDSAKPIKPGTDLLLSEILNMGTAYVPKDEFNKKALKECTDVYFYAKNNEISISTRSDRNDVNPGIDLAKDVLLAPNFSQESLEKAKAQLKLDYESNPKSPDDLARESLFPSNPKFVSYDKSVKNLDNVTLDDVKAMYADMIKNGAVKVTVTSSPKAEQKTLSRLQNIPLKFQKYNYNFNPDRTQLDKTKVITQAEDRNQAAIVQMYKTKASGNIKDIAALMVMNKVMSDGKEGLFNDLREKQKLAYTVKSKFMTDNEDGFIQLSIKTTTDDTANGIKQYDNVQKSLEGFNKHVKTLMDQKVSESDLKEAKLGLLSNVVFDTESASGKHTQIVSNSNSYYGTGYTKALTKAIENVTAEDIQKAAKINFAKPSVVSIIANKDTIEANKQYLQSIGEVEQA